MHYLGTDARGNIALDCFTGDNELGVCSSSSLPGQVAGIEDCATINNLVCG